MSVDSERVLPSGVEGSNAPNKVFSFQYPSYQLDRPVWCMDSVAGEIYAMFGADRTRILPTHAGDGSVVQCTSDETTSQEFQSLLVKHDLSIELGPASGQLGILSFKSRSDFVAFIQKNPKLKTALQTQFQKEYMVWIRAVGTHANEVHLAHCRWQSKGYVRLVNRGRKAPQHYYAAPAAPAEVSLHELHWLPDDEVAWQHVTIVERCGEPMLKGGTPNWAYWGVMVTEPLQVYWDPSEGCFWRSDAGGCMPYSTKELIRYIASKTELLAHYHSMKLLSLSLPGPMKTAITAIKCQRARCMVSQEDFLTKFLSECCVQGDGGNVTVTELVKAYKRWALNHGHQVISESRVRCAIRPTVFKVFGLTPSGSIKRPVNEGGGTVLRQQNGFRELRLKVLSMVPDELLG